MSLYDQYFHSTTPTKRTQTTPQNLTENIIPIRSAAFRTAGDLVDVVGVVVHHFPPTMTSTGEHMLTLELRDRSLVPGGRTEMRVRIFSQREADLPAVSSCGDILVLHNMRITIFRSAVMLTNDKALTMCSLWRLPPSANVQLPPITYPTKLKIPPAVHALVKKVRLWCMDKYPPEPEYISPWEKAKTATASTPAVVPTRDRFSLVKDMVAPMAGNHQTPRGNYFDMVGKVVKTFNDCHAYELYITDYTENKHLYDYQRDPNDPRHLAKWRGPWGKYTLQITLWDINQQMALGKIMEGGYLYVRNICLRYDATKKSIEGSLHKDQQHPTRPDFTVISNKHDPRVRAIEQREDEYWRRYEKEELRKIKQAEREAAAKLRAEEEARQKQLEAMKELQRVRGDNKNIWVERPDWPVTLIGDILDVDLGDRYFVNRKYHIVCKVLQHRPCQLEKFSTYGIPPGHTTERWRWRFALLVEGRDGRIFRVIVMDDDAEMLLGFPATDLASHPDELARLRSRLALLWGNASRRQNGQLPPLPPAAPANETMDSEPPTTTGKKRRRKKKKRSAESVGESEHQNKKQKMYHDRSDEKPLPPEDQEPVFFDANVKEFGYEMPVGNRLRMWALFGTTIMSRKDRDWTC